MCTFTADSLCWLYCTAGSRWADIDLSNISIVVRRTCQFYDRFTISWIGAASWSTEFQFCCVWQQSTRCWKWVVIVSCVCVCLSVPLLWWSLQVRQCPRWSPEKISAECWHFRSGAHSRCYSIFEEQCETYLFITAWHNRGRCFQHVGSARLKFAEKCLAKIDSCLFSVGFAQTWREWCIS